MNNSQAQSAFSDDPSPTTEAGEQQVVIPVVEEELQVGRRVVETGGIRISKKISERTETVDEPILQEQVSMERVQINQFVDAPPQPRQEGDTLVIPVVQETLVVQKRLLLVEELHIRKQVREIRDPQNVTLLKEEVEVERIQPDENPGV